MPSLFKLPIKIAYKHVFERNVNKKEYEKMKLALQKAIKKYDVKDNKLVYVELTNGLKFYLPKYKFHKRNGFDALMDMCPIITEIYSLILIPHYDKFRKLKKGDVIIDAGANIGYFSIYASKLIGPSGKIIAIEPEDQNIALLKRNAKINGCKNIVFVKKAVSEKRGKTTLLLSNSETHRLQDSKELNSKLSNTSTFVITDTLTNIIRAAGIKKLDFIKMDIEGAEIEAIMCSSNILKKYKPYLSIAAYHIVNGKPTYAKLIPFLKANGYTILKEAVPHIYANN